MCDFDDYIKCGEILLSPSVTDKDQFILKCSDCDKFYSELRFFIPHWQNHYIDEESELDDVYEEDAWIDGPLHKEELKEELDVKQEEIEDEHHQASIAEIGEQFIIECSNDLDAEEETTYIPAVLTDNDEDAHMEEEENSESDHPTEQEIQEDLDEEYEVEEDDEEGEDEDDPIKDSETKDFRTILKRNKHRKRQKIEKSNVLIEIFKSKAKVSTFIASYRNRPNLWEIRVSVQLSAKQRAEYLEQIAKEFEEKHKMKLTLDQVREIITHLRTRHRVAARNASNSDENKPKPEWFVELLNFLPSSTFNATIDELGSHSLKKSQIIQILKIYEQFPFLWNSEYAEYVCNNKRDEALQEMLNVIQAKMRLKIDIADLKRYVYDINQFCSKEKRLEIKNADPENMSEYKPYMEYLRDHVTPFKCVQCKKKFLQALTYKIHLNGHSGDNTIKCKICGKPYSNVEPYIQHCRRHMDDLPVECKECGKRFIRDADLKTHMRTHTGVKPYCCEICGKEFRYSNALVLHTRRHKKEYRHTCPVCPRQFYSKDGLNNHMDIHKEERNRICKICGKAFKSKSTLKSHILTHETGLNHACELCGKLFKNRLGIYHHMKTHRRKEPQQN
ncbi:uncharacterized protein [Musca autumnalis]|uniref:uncharacterized protein n=1 Tax=Musca autumnalis TaxID=221902 RepID=UPI003CF76058